EIEAEPFLDATQAGAVGEIEKQGEIENDGRRQDRIAAQEIDLDLHGVAEPAEDVDVVPAFFVVAARRIVVDADLMVNLLVEVRINTRLKNIFERAELGFFLGLERAGIV